MQSTVFVLEAPTPLHNFALGPLTTFGAAARAATYYRCTTAEALQATAAALDPEQAPVLVLGGGSNVLFRADWPGSVVHVCNSGIEVFAETPGTVHVRVAAGEVWHHLVQWAVRRGWGGLENLALIPGTVGAAPIQNIGAYGVELEAAFVELLAYELGSGTPRRFTASECAFGYRDSVFKNAEKGRWVIAEVVLELQKQPVINTRYGALQAELEAHAQVPWAVEDVFRAVVRVRQSKLPDPAVLGNCGSFFKNPVVAGPVYATLKRRYPELPAYPQENGGIKLAAGWLIEQAFGKGKRVGAVGTYEKQALVLVNHGGATGEAAWEFAQGVQKAVKARFGIVLQPEVNILPE